MEADIRRLVEQADELARDHVANLQRLLLSSEEDATRPTGDKE